MIKFCSLSFYPHRSCCRSPAYQPHISISATPAYQPPPTIFCCPITGQTNKLPLDWRAGYLALYYPSQNETITMRQMVFFILPSSLKKCKKNYLRLFFFQWEQISSQGDWLRVVGDFGYNNSFQSQLETNPILHNVYYTHTHKWKISKNEGNVQCGGISRAAKLWQMARELKDSEKVCHLQIIWGFVDFDWKIGESKNCKNI